nr:hypothetical protein [bacterium]
MVVVVGAAVVEVAGAAVVVVVGAAVVGASAVEGASLVSSPQAAATSMMAASSHVDFALGNRIRFFSNLSARCGTYRSGLNVGLESAQDISTDIKKYLSLISFTLGIHLFYSVKPKRN